MLLLPFIVSVILYRKTTYYKTTHNRYYKVLLDKGLYGEFLIYKNLREFEKQGARFIFNCYLPRENNRTTEIDVIMIWNSGVYVFESKNYSGWIFGHERRKVWTQCLPRGKGQKAKKIKFFNPIFQNKLHIKCLKMLLQQGCPEIHSIVVFSDRCTLKDIKTHSRYKDVSVIHRGHVKETVEMINSSTPEMTPDILCDEIYSILSEYTNVSDDIKKKHIEDIEKQFNGIDENEIINESEELSPTQVELDKNTLDIVAQIKNNTDEKDRFSELIKKCPRCGSPLALRTAKRGANAGKQFYGCNNYPKCKYTEQL